MAETIRGINVKIGSDTTGLSAALKDVNKNSRDIASELKKVEKLLKFNPKDTQLLAQKQELLSKQVDNTREKLDRLKAAQEQVNEQFQKGDITEGQYRAFERELIKTSSQLEHFKEKLHETARANITLSKRLNEVGDTLQSTGQKLKSIGSTMSMKFTAPLVAGFGLVTKGTEELRQDLARLETNAEQAGIGADKISDSLTRLSGISDETDSNVEALSNLLATGFDEQGMTEALDALSGAVIKFPDTLKIEGLADGLQETLATGKAVGPFAELLERMGVNLDTFNEGLSDATANGEKQNYVLQTLASTGLAEVNEAYRENNKSIVESREAQAELQQALADLGNTVAPIVTKATDLIADLIAEFNELSPTGKKVALSIAGIGAAIGPVLVGAGAMAEGFGSLAIGIGKLPGMFNKLKITLAGVSAASIGTVAGVAAFAAIAVEVYRNWDETKNALASIWDLIKSSAVQLGLNVAITFEKMKHSVIGAVNEILERLSILEDLPFGLGDKFAGLKDRVSEGVDGSAQKIEELRAKLEENSDRMSEALDNTKVAFGDLGAKISEDVKGAIAPITRLTGVVKAAEKEQTETITEEQQKQTEVTVTENEERTDATLANETEQTDIVDEEAQERARLREEFEQKWNQKLFQLTADRIEQLEAEKEAQLAKAEELGADKTAIYEYYAIKRQEILDEELAKEQDREQKRLDALAKFEQEWAKKLFEATATNLELLEKEKNEALAKAEELGASKADIIAYYALKEQEIIDARNAEAERKRQEEAQKELEAQQKKEQLRAQFEQSWTAKLFQQTATREQILEAEKKAALQKAEELGADKTAIIQYYANEEQRVRDEQRAKEKEAEEKALAEKEERAKKERKILKKTAESWTESYMEIVDSMVESGKAVGEVLKEIVVKVITALEKQVIATQMAELAKAWAQSWWDWTAVARALGSIAVSTAAFEGAKSLVRGLATGGVVEGGSDQLFRLGDGREDEAVVPLNERVLSNLGAAIASNMPSAQPASYARPVEVHLHVGTMVADKFGLKQLERQLQGIRLEENLRLGMSKA